MRRRCCRPASSDACAKDGTTKGKAEQQPRFRRRLAVPSSAGEFPGGTAALQYLPDFPASDEDIPEPDSKEPA